ncbi:MAG: tetratricopeptide repeat protein, partial [Candidatus Eisenbacteria bacterium]|nr:tetratricopeptide repeat protein [Candidatus Latescibacterota bacterium]MBD3301799.1 tetratricopeptide repeat protein [Candidatus Eisenbacteria bacterium]
MNGEKPGSPARLGSEPRNGGRIEELLTRADLEIGIEDHAQAVDRLMRLRGEKGLTRELRFAVDRRIAACLERLGRTDEARRVARSAIDGVPEGIDPHEQARCLLVAGKAALELGQLPEAERDATDVIRLLGEDALSEEAGSAQNLLGTVAFRNGRPDAARSRFEKALAIYRRLGDLQHLAGTYVNLGNLHKLRSDWERAAEHYQVAYYLGKTLGEGRVVAGAAQNLGIVLSKTGRYREARGFFERVLKLATETGDPVRVSRACLALAKVARAERRTTRARKLLESCTPIDRSGLPERERCLLLLESTRLDLEDGLLEPAVPRAAELRLRVEAMAPRGDLMVETLLLEADMAALGEDWDAVAEAASQAKELAREDRDRSQEERAHQRLARAWAHAGRIGEAESALAGLIERHRSRKEWPAVATAWFASGRISAAVKGDFEAALEAFEHAVEIYRKIDLPRAEALVEAEQVAVLIRLGRHVEAIERIDSLRRSASDPEDPFPGLADRLANLTEGMTAVGPPERIDRPDGLQVHERLEAMLAAPGSAWERLHEVLVLLRDALEVDTVVLGEVEEGERLAPVGAVGLETIDGKGPISFERLGLVASDLSGPSYRLELEPASAGRVGSRILVPMTLRGRPHLLCLLRRPDRGRGPVGRAEANYAMVLAAELNRALEVGSPDQEAARLSSGIALADVITQDPRMQQILELIRRVGDTDLSVLLQGETGTGKKLLAHALHRASGRRIRPIVTVDCAALPESLLEAELFGYRKGSFTGATQDRNGLLAEAAGGTVFLDEIDKAGLTVQRRFLHLLDSGEIRPVGATTYLRLDVRIVCATSSPDLRKEVAEGRFLKDLYYRLNDISIQIPPLRERREDIPLLAGCFVETFTEQTGRKIRGMSAAFRRALVSHDWPGNVRELEKAIRRAVTLADDDIILTPEL